MENDDLRTYYSIGDKVKYLTGDTMDAKPGEVVKITKGTIKVKYNGYSLTLSKVKLPEFTNSLKKITHESKL